MRKRNILFIVLVIFLIASFYKIKVKPVENTFLIPKEELIYTDIASIEIINIDTNDSIVIDDMLEIDKIASFLTELNTENADTYENNPDAALYFIYISKIGYYPAGPIAIFEDSLVYKDKQIYISSEKLAEITRFLNGVISKNPL